MVLCELVLASAFVAEGETADIDGNATLPLRFEGLPLAGGIGHGKAFIHRGPRPVHDLVSEDSEREIDRLNKAIDAFLRRIQILISQSASRIGDAEREILGTYRMFAEDLGWQRRMREEVMDGLTAEGAVCRVQEENRRRQERGESPRSLGRTELGRVIAGSGGAITCTTVQLPTFGYHTPRETVSLAAMAATRRLLERVLGLGGGD